MADVLEADGLVSGTPYNVSGGSGKIALFMLVRTHYRE
jgi:hypothetical protein